MIQQAHDNTRTTSHTTVAQNSGLRPPLPPVQNFSLEIGEGHYTELYGTTDTTNTSTKTPLLLSPAVSTVYKISRTARCQQKQQQQQQHPFSPLLSPSFPYNFSFSLFCSINMSYWPWAIVAIKNSNNNNNDDEHLILHRRKQTRSGPFTGHQN